MSRMRDKVTVSATRDEHDRLIGYVARRVAPCNKIHEGHGKKKYHALSNLNEAIQACPGCVAALSAQSQSVVS